MTTTVRGSVDVAYSHFCLGEGGPDSELADFHSGEPVLVSRGMITITTRVQEQQALVTVRLVDRHTAPPAEWELVSTVTYRPVHQGVVTVCHTMNGRAMDDLHLDPGTIYHVHVYAQGREGSRERFYARLDRGEFGKRGGLEEYLIVFEPAGSQPRPQIKDQRRLPVDNNGRRPANLSRSPTPARGRA